MATYASIKYDMDLASSATGAGALTLLATTTASSDSTISFTSGIDSTYKEYVFKFYDIHPSAAQEFMFQADTGTNTSYHQTITSTAFQAYHREDGTDQALGYAASSDLGQGTGFQRLSTATVNTNNDDSLAGELFIYEPSNTTFVKHFMARTSSPDSNFAYTNFIAGYFNTTTALTRVRFKMSSGNTDAGVIKLYGVS